MPNLNSDSDVNAPLHKQFKRLTARIGVDLFPEEYRDSAHQLLERYATRADARDASQISAFLNVLVRRNCHPVLVTELARVLTADTPHRTVNAAANHADLSRRTLERHWKVLHSERHLRDCFRLALLLRITREHGDWRERARAAGISIESARSLAQELTGQSLLALIRRPTSVIEVLEAWLA